MTPDLATQWDDWAADNVPPDATTRHRVQARRAFMAGAAAALSIVKQSDGLDKLRAQVVAIGRTVGTEVEAAR